MRIRYFKHDKQDCTSLNKWLARRKHEGVRRHELPRLGWIIPGVAAAFARECEGGVYILDSYVSNSLVSPLIRNAAIDELTVHIVKTLELAQGFWVFTTDEHTIIRAKKHGFKQLPHAVLTKGN